MSEKITKIQQLTRDVAFWKNRAVEAAIKACDNCEEYAEGRKKCAGCRIMEIKEDAEK